MTITLTQSRWLLGVVTVALGVLVLARAWVLYQQPLDGKTAQAHRPIQVDTALVTRGASQQWLTAHGIARAVRRKALRFEIPGFEAPGKVTFIKKDKSGRELREGDRVQGPASSKDRGELLAAVDDQLYVLELKSTEAGLKRAHADVTAAMVELERAQGAWSLQRAVLERARSLHGKQLMSQQSLDEAQADITQAQAALATAKAQLKSARFAVREYTAKHKQVAIALERTRLYAPFDGVVAHLDLRVGDYINRATAGDTLASLVLIDPSVFEVTLELPPWDGERVREGQSARVFLDYPTTSHEWPGPDQAVIPAIVYSVSPAVSETRRLIRVRLRLEAHSTPMLRDGQSVNARIRIDEKPNALLIPIEALVFHSGQSYVFVIDPKSGVVAQHRVHLGIQDAAQVEILDGLEAGELIVRHGQSRLAPGAQVQWVHPAQPKPRLHSIEKTRVAS